MVKTSCQHGTLFYHKTTKIYLKEKIEFVCLHVCMCVHAFVLVN